MTDFTDYQQKAYEFATYPSLGVRSELYSCLELCGEAGEVMEVIKKEYRDREARFDAHTMDRLEKELGDVLWALAALATELGLSLEAIARHNIEKLESRRERGTLLGDGDNR